MQHAPPAYRADIDGLRAVAVVAILLYHAQSPGFGGGFVGVDIFYVISGFVIALSVNRDLMAGRFSLSGFYERRVRRILPALITVLLATLAVSLWLAPPAVFAPFARSLVFASSFLANFYFWRSSNYFDAESPFKPLLHTWSLAVEEQYYIFAPLFLFCIYRFLGRRWALGVLPPLVASLALSLYAVAHHQMNAAFFLLPTRAWEILLGAFMALAPPPPVRRRFVSEALSLVAVGLMAGCIFFYTVDIPFPGLAAVPPCLATAILLHLGASPTRPTVSRLLAWRPFVAVGLISYSLYLVHWPVIVLTRFALLRPMTAGETVAALAACFLLAGGLYLLVERPVRRAPAPRALVFGLAALAIAATVAAGLVGPGLNQRIFPQSPPGVLQKDWGPVEKAWRVGDCMARSGADYRDWRLDRCVLTGGAGEDVLLFGDSFAAHYAPGLAAHRDAFAGRIVEYAVMGCPPVIDFGGWRFAECHDFTKNVIQVIKGAGIRRVVVAGSWLEYGEDISLRVESTLRTFHEMGIETTLIGQSPHFHVEPRLAAAKRGQEHERDISVAIGDRPAKMNAGLAAIAARTGARFVDPMAILCEGDVCPVRIGGRELYMDYGHFTAFGSDRAVLAYFPYLRRPASAGKAVTAGEPRSFASKAR